MTGAECVCVNSIREVAHILEIVCGIINENWMESPAGFLFLSMGGLLISSL